MRSVRRWLIVLALLILAFLLIAPSQGDLLKPRAGGKTSTVQASLISYDHPISGSESRAR